MVQDVCEVMAREPRERGQSVAGANQQQRLVHAALGRSRFQGNESAAFCPKLGRMRRAFPAFAGAFAQDLRNIDDGTMEFGLSFIGTKSA